MTKKAAKTRSVKKESRKGAGSTRRRSTPSVLKKEIEKLDRQILKLINERAAKTILLLESSEDWKRAVYDPRGDEDLWKSLEEKNPGPLPSQAVRSIFRHIVSGARRQLKTQRVAFLGPEYSFTHLAAVERFGESAEYIPVSSIAAVFEEVHRRHADYGIVPIENSTDGRIVDTLDMFVRLPLKICGEVQIRIHHNLLARCPRNEIVEIYSKPQALSQCREWLARNMPQAELIEVLSTSTAAQLARDKPGAAAVASRQAALKYDLTIVAENIEDNPNNITRFAIIGEDEFEPTGKDRTSLLMQVPHKPGALADALVIFKKQKINMTWIESFPLRGPEPGYVFFIDFEGHQKERRVRKLLEMLESRTVRLNVLGSYPQSEPVD